MIHSGLRDWQHAAGVIGHCAVAKSPIILGKSDLHRRSTLRQNACVHVSRE